MKIRNNLTGKPARPWVGPNGTTLHWHRAPRRQDGLAVIVVLALLAFVLIFVGANLKALASLHRDLNQVEKQQVRRWIAFSATNNLMLELNAVATNAPSAGGEIQRNPKQK